MTPEQKQLIQEAKVFREILKDMGMKITNRFSFVGDIVILEATTDLWITTYFLNHNNLSNYIAQRTQRFAVIDFGIRKRWFRNQRFMNIWLHRENPHHD
jgi:hypothetical protein